MIRYDIIRRPLITEKTTIQKDEANQVTFEVDRRANRIEIGRAVEKIFKVINNIKRRGRTLGRRRDWKKAIVTLRPGERIDFFEGA